MEFCVVSISSSYTEDITTKKSLSALFRYILTNCTGLEKQTGEKRSADQGDKLSPILFYFFKWKWSADGLQMGWKLVFWGVLGLKSYSKYVRRQFTGLGLQVTWLLWKDLFPCAFVMFSQSCCIIHSLVLSSLQQTWIWCAFIWDRVSCEATRSCSG